MSKVDRFPDMMRAFFYEWLVEQRNASIHTVRSYRDTWRLLLRFVAQRTGKKVAMITLADLAASEVAAFLSHTEHDRGGTIGTRNCRDARPVLPLPTTTAARRISDGRAVATSSNPLAAPVSLKLAIFSSASRWLRCRLWSVRRKACTELSSRLSRLVVMSACRLRSRSTCRNFIRLPSSSVSYKSSYFCKRLAWI